MIDVLLGDGVILLEMGAQTLLQTMYISEETQSFLFT